MLALLLVGAAAGDERKNRGDEDGTFWRAACGVPCDWACCDRRGVGEDIFADVKGCLTCGFRGIWTIKKDASNASRKSIYYGRLESKLRFFDFGCFPVALELETLERLKYSLI